MKDIVKYLFFCAVAILTMTSCNRYDYEEAEEFVDEIRDGETFTNEDYSEMLDLCEIAFEKAISTTQEIIDLKDKTEKKDRIKELEDSEFEDMIKLNTVIWAELCWAEGTDELNAANKKQFKNVMKLAKKLEKNFTKISNQLDGDNHDSIFGSEDESYIERDSVASSCVTVEEMCEEEEVEIIELFPEAEYIPIEVSAQEPLDELRVQDDFVVE